MCQHARLFFDWICSYIDFITSYVLLQSITQTLWLFWITLLFLVLYIVIYAIYIYATPLIYIYIHGIDPLILIYYPTSLYIYIYRYIVNPCQSTNFYILPHPCIILPTYIQTVYTYIYYRVIPLHYPTQKVIPL